jgi:hypothetical protein
LQAADSTAHTATGCRHSAAASNLVMCGGPKTGCAPHAPQRVGLSTPASQPAKPASQPGSLCTPQHTYRVLAARLLHPPRYRGSCCYCCAVCAARAAAAHQRRRASGPPPSHTSHGPQRANKAARGAAAEGGWAKMADKRPIELEEGWSSMQVRSWCTGACPGSPRAPADALPAPPAPCSKASPSSSACWRASLRASSTQSST